MLGDNFTHDLEFDLEEFFTQADSNDDQIVSKEEVLN